MALMMLLAHLVGDYLLQWDRLARWKARALPGVLAHGAIVISVNCLLAALIAPSWWPWAAAIGIVHVAIDGSKLRLQRYYPPLHLYVADQAAHLAAIGLALIASGALRPLPADTEYWLTLAVGYAFVTLPVWVLAEYLTYHLVYNSAPEFAYRSHKYVGSIERTLVMTCVITGLIGLVPVVALPRLVTGPPSKLYRVEWLLGVGIALLTGTVLSAVG